MAALPAILCLALFALAQDEPGSNQEERVLQLQNGVRIYEERCARCHDFSRPRHGTEQLAMRLGSKELAWHGSVEKLLAYVSDYMPFDEPATLTESQYLDITAFLLYRVELLPASVLLTPETLGIVELPPYLPARP